MFYIVYDMRVSNIEQFESEMNAYILFDRPNGIQVLFIILINSRLLYLGRT